MLTPASLTKPLSMQAVTAHRAKEVPEGNSLFWCVRPCVTNSKRLLTSPVCLSCSGRQVIGWHGWRLVLIGGAARHGPVTTSTGSSEAGVKVRWWLHHAWPVMHAMPLCWPCMHGQPSVACSIIIIISGTR